MGDPRKNRKKFATPAHPWQKARIDEEKKLTDDYGLKNKKEIWRLTSQLRDFSKQAKSLIALKTDQGEKERQQLISKLHSLNLLSERANLDDVLSLTPEDIMERRLQTIVFKKGLASSTKQARQLIVHGHVLVGGKKVTVPSYLVSGDEETSISLTAKMQVQVKGDEKSKE